MERSVISDESLKDILKKGFREIMDKILNTSKEKSDKEVLKEYNNPELLKEPEIKGFDKDGNSIVENKTEERQNQGIRRTQKIATEKNIYGDKILLEKESQEIKETPKRNDKKDTEREV